MGGNWKQLVFAIHSMAEGLRKRSSQIIEQIGVNETLNHLVLGSEATLWTEQADDQSVGNRLWPRAAAMAEQLWSNGGKWDEAEHRFLLHRQRMVEYGINPDTVEPEWCLQNPGNCY
uniref:beta-N-acetylhexosaminidase n=1 Tax=Lygus hesperus TaxID=30085 RepID=A0A0A9VQH6_LYGHE